MSRRTRNGRTTALVGVLLAGALVLVGLLVLTLGEERGRSDGAQAKGAWAENADGREPASVGRDGTSAGGAGAGVAAQGLDGAEAGSTDRANAGAERVSVSREGEDAVASLKYTGRLLDASTEAPVEGARIALGDARRSAEARSDEDGAFSISWFEDAPADLSVEHAAYVDAHVAEVDLSVPGTIRLLRSARILGRIEPAPEEAGGVALAWHQATSSHRYWSEFESEIEADGSFVLPDLVPGQYAVSARVPGLSVPIEYGFQLESGADLEVRLASLEGGVLFGKVLRGVAFEPAAGVEIELRPGGKRLPPMLEALRTASATTGPDGTYELAGLGPGNYHFTLRSEEGDIKVGTLDVPADGLRIERDFQLPGPAQVGGRVVDADGKAVPGARVVAFAMGDTHRTLGARTGEFDEDTPEARAGADGVFLLESAPTKRLLVVLAYPPEFDPGRDGSVAPGSVVLEGLGPGEIRSDVVIQIPPGERILGTVRAATGETLSGVTVSAQRYFGQRFVSLGIVVADEDGRFELHPLLPGKYRVLAVDERHWPNIVETEVDGGIDAKVELVLDLKQSIRGIARDPAGAGIAGLPVRLRIAEEGTELDDAVVVAEIERPTTVYGRTDAFGRFTVEELYAGTWTVFSSSYAWEFLSADPDRLQVPEDSRVELTLVPRDQRRERFAITGVVALAEGGIPSGVKIEGLHGGFLEIDGGEFKATGLTPTRHRLWVSSAGHARMRLPAIDPVPGRTVDVGRIELWPTTRLTVTLRTKDGSVPDDTKVSLDPIPTADGGSPLGRRLVLTSLGKGRYRTNQATRHAWTLRVRHPDYRNVGRRLEVAAQDQQGVDVELRPSK